MTAVMVLRRYGGDLVYRGQDDHGVLEVVDRVDLRSLHFGTPALQSRMRRDEPAALLLDYTQAMMLPLLFHRPGSVLLLGLGGGSLAKYLLHTLSRCRLQVVELRAAVVRVAEAFFFLSQDSRLAVTVCDAQRFVRESRRSYDLILLDLFDGWGPAPILLQPGFLDDCRRLLNHHGVLAANLWCQESVQAETDLAQLFPDCCLSLPMADQDNRVVLAFRGGLPRWSFRQARRQARELSPGLNLPLLSLVSELWRHNRHCLITT